MSFQTWLLYAAAVFVLTVTPGPTVLGIMVCSVIGLGAALAASAKRFGIVKWAGVTYLRRGRSSR